MDFKKLFGLPADPIQSNRPIRLRLTHESAVTDQVLLVARIAGREAICGGIDYRLNCLSTLARIPLKEFIALPAELQFVTDRGTLHSVCGIVAQASTGPSDGGLATYRLTLRDAFSLMEQRINTRVFRGMSELDIAVLLIREWRLSNPVLAWAFDIDTTGIRNVYPAREFTMQHNESDAAFLRRLLKRRGIPWFIRHDTVDQAGKADGVKHTLVLFDTPHSLQRNAAGTVRFHRDAATEARDSVFEWNAVRNLQTGLVSRQSADYRQAQMMFSHSPTLTRQGATGDRFALSLEDYQVDAPHLGNDGNDYRILGDLRIKLYEYEAKCFHGESGVRDLRVGQWFRLDGHPEIDTHSDVQREFVVTELSLAAESNLPQASMSAPSVCLQPVPGAIQAQSR